MRFLAATESAKDCIANSALAIYLARVQEAISLW